MTVAAYVISLALMIEQLIDWWVLSATISDYFTIVCINLNPLIRTGDEDYAAVAIFGRHLFACAGMCVCFRDREQEHDGTWGGGSLCFSG